MADVNAPPPSSSSPLPHTATRSGQYREVTLSALILGLILGCIINAAITYAGLKIGFTIVGSAIIAVLGFGVLRGILRRGSILEINIAQTFGSAVDTTSSGVIFTIPVLFLLGDGMEFEFWDRKFWLLVVACSAGAVLGSAFIIPLRKQMIDVERLRFPSGTAVAAILKSPGAGAKKSLVLLAGMVISAAIYAPTSLPAIKVRAGLDELGALVERGKITNAEADRTRLIDQWIRADAAPEEVIARGRAEQARIDAEEIKPAEADQLALAVYKVSAGERSWSDLRREFWAKKPLFGYSDLNVRLPARQSADGSLRPDVDHDANGEPDLLLTDGEIDVGRFLGIPSQYALIFAIAPFSLGAGYLSGRAGLYVLAGGVLAYHILNPYLFANDLLPATVAAHEVADYARVNISRPMGIGMLLGGAMLGVVSTLPAIKEALKSIAFAGKSKGGSDELGLKTIAIAAGLALVLLYFAADFIHNPNTPAGGLLAPLNVHLRSLIIALVGAGWIWFAGIIIAQCTGMTDWSPISGMALITVVLVMALAGTSEVLGAVLIGAALCSAITLAADMMTDLKTGYLVGSVPRKQQMVELCGAAIGPVISIATLLLIVEGNRLKFGVPLGEGTDTTAPQAQALQAVITGVQGGELPYALYGFGALLGVLLGLGAFASLGVLVGLSMYLPIVFILTYGVGCLLSMIAAKVVGKRPAEEWGVPFAAGLIVGEAIFSLVINSIVLIQGAV